jgi:hypothetical protein
MEVDFSKREKKHKGIATGVHQYLQLLTLSQCFLTKMATVSFATVVTLPIWQPPKNQSEMVHSARLNVH